MIKLTLNRKAKKILYNRAYYHSGKGKIVQKRHLENQENVEGIKRALATQEKIKIDLTRKYSEQRKDRVLKNKYGLSLKQYKQMYEDQSYQCAICGEKKKLHVDHCHKTGKVRGLLCHRCNLRIVPLAEQILDRNTPLLDKAKEYVNKHRANSRLAS